MFLTFLAFLAFFVIRQPGEAARLVKVTGENAGELFGAAGDAFVKFMKTLI